ncbi:Sulfate adenylyltransferase subunit 1 / Adenylylsulfate kinase [hydrothermal vent metagenome]|uniref:sulfate adenylyltransferase n=1 Tax=hydrothermal vent metagenome TaxID=652676 RepID=A0A3B1CIU1_9ZZZZ
MIKERMNIVIVGHVDHGKSTLVGRLLADTESLPKGKLDFVKKQCEKNSKPFEYAFLLDALVDEQNQGITIDTARVFFESSRREYIIIDAPGHIEFLKNMISGAARAEAALLLIDADEGIAENSRRHAYMLSLLGIKQIAVVVNKMDLVDYNQNVFNKIKLEYTKYLKSISIEATNFIPISAREGINLIDISPLTDWYEGASLLEIVDSFTKEKTLDEKPLRMYLQGIYKFDGHKNKKRIYAGSINSGKVNIGDRIGFLPSGKSSIVNSVEIYNKSGITSAKTGQAIGLTLKEEIYVNETDLVYKLDERNPEFSDRVLANIFWMSNDPLRSGKSYKLKIGTQQFDVLIEQIQNVLHTADLDKVNSNELVNKHEAAKCVLKLRNRIPFDLVEQNVHTSRFVLVDKFDIVGGGMIIKNMEDSKPKKTYSDFEIELNEFIRQHFPHWEAKSLEEII